MTVNIGSVPELKSVSAESLFQIKKTLGKIELCTIA